MQEYEEFEYEQGREGWAYLATPIIWLALYHTLLMSISCHSWKNSAKSPSRK